MGKMGQMEPLTILLVCCRLCLLDEVAVPPLLESVGGRRWPLACLQGARWVLGTSKQVAKFELSLSFDIWLDLFSLAADRLKQHQPPAWPPDSCYNFALPRAAIVSILRNQLASFLIDSRCVMTRTTASAK